MIRKTGILSSTKYACSFVFTAAISLISVFHLWSKEAIWEWSTTSDSLTIPTLAEELLDSAGSFQYWQLPRAPFLFPDGIVYLLFRIINIDRLLSLVFTATLTIILFCILAAILLNKSSTIRVSSSDILFSSLVVLIIISLFSQDDTVRWWIIKYFASSNNHFTYAVYASINIVLVMKFLETRHKYVLLCSIPITTLCSMSNPAFLVYFSPALLVIVILVRFQSHDADLRKSINRISLYQTFALFIGSALWYLLDTQPSAQISLSPKDVALRAKAIFVSLLDVTQKSSVATVYLLLIIVLMIFAMTSFSGLLKTSSTLFDYKEKLILRRAIAVSSSLNILFATFAWENIDSSRYLMMFALIPLVFAPLFLRNLCELVFNRHTNLFRLNFGTRCFLVISIVFVSINELHGNFDQFRDRKMQLSVEAASLQDCIKNAGGDIGLANYWIARKETYLTGNAIHLLQLTPWPTDLKGLLFIWGNNRNDYYSRFMPSSRVNYLITNGIEESVINKEIPRPMRKVSCSNYDIFVYGAADQLLSVFRRGHGELFSYMLKRKGYVSIPASDFYTEIGKYEFSAIKSQGETGLMLFGNYLKAPIGNVVVQLNYRCNSEHREEKEIGVFELVGNFGSDLLATTPVYCQGVHNNVNLQLVINDESLFEPRVYYNSKHELVFFESVMVHSSLRNLSNAPNTSHATSLLQHRP